tara:strand:- start:11104 stop:12237 length:1134 start_codon:yes stop_codon:yes gene_type:complete
MPSFNFKKEVKLFLVHDSKKYRIDVNQIDFGQTFQETSYPVKTLHNQSSFEGSVINRANPAEFSFNTPLLQEERHKVVFDRLLDSTTFDLYISTESDDVWKLEKCVIQDGTFEINKSRPLRLSISGEASKLSKHSGAIPGTLQTAGTTTTTYIVPDLPTLTLGSDDVSKSIVGMTVSLQNDINWNNYNTVQGATTATNAATSQYPTNFTVGTKVLSGTISKYLDDESTSVLTWNSNTSLRLRVGKDVGKGIASVTVTSGGTGYSSAPTVSFTGAGGTGGAGTTVLSSGAVQSVTITAAGRGYTSNPTVVFNGGSPLVTAAGTSALTATSEIVGIDFNITNCSFTNRMSTPNVFREEYNWRMTQNPTALSSVITYTTT